MIKSEDSSQYTQTGTDASKHTSSTKHSISHIFNIKFNNWGVTKV